MKTFSFIAVLFVLLCCSFICSAHKLIKLCRTSANYETLRTNWYVTLSHLIIIPVIYCSINDNTLLEALICAGIWFVFRFKPKMVPINILGLCIIILLIPVNILLVKNFYVYYNHTN